MLKKSLFWGWKKKNVHEFCVFERYLLRKSTDFLIICYYFANFVSKIKPLPMQSPMKNINYGSCFWAAFLKMGSRHENSPTIS